MTTRTMLLAAGLGTRVHPMTRHRPKAFLPVGDAPLLEQMARQLQELGETSAAINCHWQPEYFYRHIQKIPFTFKVSSEASLLGSAGGIAAARQYFQAPVAVWNADIVIANPPLAALRHQAETSRGVCLCVAPSPGKGTVGVDRAGRVVRLRGESFGREHRAMDYVGLCGLSASTLAELPAEGCLIGDLCLPRLRGGARIDTLETGEPWRDIGSVSGYFDANLQWLRARYRSEDRPASGSYVAPAAHIDPGVQIRDSVVGQAARVVGQGAVEQCIVWPGATASAPLSRCIVTPDDVVPIP